MTTLRKMSEEEFENFLVLSKKNYKQDKIKANKLTEVEAEKIATDDFARYLPEGYATKDSYLFIIVDDAGITAGHLWFVIRGPDENKKAFIADIFLYEEHRGKGHGKKAMLLVEEEVKKMKIGHLGLHVFGFNETAIGLYKSLNYDVTDLVMEKCLS